MTRLWMIRNDEFPASELVAGGFISIGWDRVGDLVSIGDDQVAIRRIVREMYPEDKEDHSPSRQECCVASRSTCVKGTSWSHPTGRRD